MILSCYVMSPDEPLPLNCPKCPRALRYMRDTEDGYPLYVCAEHGWFIIGADGRVRETQGPDERRH